MGNVLSTLDLVIFFGSLVAIMAVGLWAGRKEDTSEDFYLAGRRTKWWGVAGSIFGSNVSANHIVGMMGVGFSVGFAQSHFEITAICGLLALCYLFLPVYRKLKVYTLSEYLGRRYDDRARLCYALIMVFIMVVVMMVPGFYIGSRSLNILLQTGETATATAVVADGGAITAVELVNGGGGYESTPLVRIAAPVEHATPAAARAVVEGGKVVRIEITAGGGGFDSTAPPNVTLRGGASFDPGGDDFAKRLSPGDTNPTYYIIGILLMAVVTGSYTIIGGLRAVIITDVIQSVLMLVAAITVAWLTFSAGEIGGWAGMRALDATPGAGKDMMHLYLPADHPGLPWTGVLSGLMVLHFYYWGANQFIVQRALSTKTDKEARLGIITAGFFKLLIPFMSIGTGIAAYYLFQKRGVAVAQDAAFSKLLTDVVAGAAPGIVGLIAAGLIGAILSSLDSMMNSASTIITFDIYQRYVNPRASEKRLILFGRVWIAILIVIAALLTIFTMDPNSADSFFLHVAKHQSNLIAGVVVAFAGGMLWTRATAAGGAAAIVAGVAFSYLLPPLYDATLAGKDAYFGPSLNFMHGVMVSALLSLGVLIVVSLLTQPNEEKSKLTWSGLALYSVETLKRAGVVAGVTLGVYVLLALLIVPFGDTERGVIAPAAAAWVAAVWTFLVFFLTALRGLKTQGEAITLPVILKEDRFWAGLLAGCAIYMMYYFF